VLKRISESDDKAGADTGVLPMRLKNAFGLFIGYSPAGIGDPLKLEAPGFLPRLSRFDRLKFPRQLQGKVADRDAAAISNSGALTECDSPRIAAGRYSSLHFLLKQLMLKTFGLMQHAGRDTTASAPCNLTGIFGDICHVSLFRPPACPIGFENLA
jgi:hypothetical protein